MVISTGVGVVFHAKEIRNKKLKIRNKEMQLQLFKIPNRFSFFVSRKARKGAKTQLNKE